MRQIEIYDTTLRDGTQREGISFSVEDKIRIVRKLDELGFHFVEGGWPGSNPKDIEFFERMQKIPLKRTVLTAFGSTRRAGITAKEDQNVQAIIRSGGKWPPWESLDFHVTDAPDHLEKTSTHLRHRLLFGFRSTGQLRCRTLL